VGTLKTEVSFKKLVYPKQNLIVFKP